MCAAPPGRRSGWLAHPLTRHLIALALLVLYVGLTYGPELRGKMLAVDDVLTVEYVRDHGPFDAFLYNADTGPWLGYKFYRPFFFFKGWFYYRLFGLNYAPYAAAEIVQHAIAVGLVYAATYRMVKRVWLALLAALVFAAHFYTAFMAVYMADTSDFTLMAAALAALLVMRPRRSAWWALALGAVTFLGAVSRENGFAVAGAVWLWALAGWRLGAVERPQAVRAGVASGLGALGYVALRLLNVGSMASVYTPGEMAPLPFYLTNGAKHLAAILFPLWNDDGGLIPLAYLFSVGLVIGLVVLIVWLVMLARRTSGGRWPSVFAAALTAVAAVLALTIAHFYPVVQPRNGGLLALYTLGVASLYGALRARAIRWRVEPWLAGAVLAFAGAAGLIATGGMVLEPLVLPIALHVGLTLVTAALAVGSARRWPREAQMMAAFALGLLVANAVISFPYFRVRLPYLGVVGWVWLAALAMRYRPRGRVGWGLAAAAVVLMAAQVVANGIELHRRLPRETGAAFPAYSILCDPAVVPEDFALTLVHQYDLSEADLLACREE